VAKVKARIQNWKAKFLSFGGRRHLIISVLQSLQLYWMAIYVFPSSSYMKLSPFVGIFYGLKVSMLRVVFVLVGRRYANPLKMVVSVFEGLRFGIEHSLQRVFGI